MMKAIADRNAPIAECFFKGKAMEIITGKEDAARDAGFNAGVGEGKQYVVDNPADFGLYTEDETYRGTLIIPIPAK